MFIHIIAIYTFIVKELLLPEKFAKSSGWRGIVYLQIISGNASIMLLIWLHAKYRDRTFYADTVFNYNFSGFHLCLKCKKTRIKFRRNSNMSLPLATNKTNLWKKIISKSHSQRIENTTFEILEIQSCNNLIYKRNNIIHAQARLSMFMFVIVGNKLEENFSACTHFFFFYVLFAIFIKIIKKFVQLL